MRLGAPARGLWLLVVVTIGVLAAIAIPAFLAQRDRTQVAPIKSDVNNTATINTAVIVVLGNAAAPTLRAQPPSALTFAGTALVPL